ncbi:GvpL/GvpF family gas vesicle protein [Nocardioides ginsengisoli]|uniref:GvpL/GvpF family gas vesicle protein n=1 Tax=Nocardioides ginsengisoli TaxID=363868 RepID=A0ABW3W3J4_9ACTN
MSAELATAVDPAAGPQPLLVYGVVRSADTGADRLDGLAAELVDAGGLAAVVGEVDPGRMRVRRADLLEYNSVLDTLAGRGPVVPVRFGSVLPDREAVAEFLTQQRDQLAAALDHLTGRRQYNLRVSYVEEVVLAELVAEDPEIRELRARTVAAPGPASYGDRVRLGELVARALENWSVQDGQALLARIAPDVAAYRVRSTSSATQVLDVALLIDDARAEEVVDRLEDLAREHRDSLRMRLVGPLAAHDFAKDAGWA